MRNSAQHAPVPRRRSGESRIRDAEQSVHTARAEARMWGQGIDLRRRQQASWSFISHAIGAYVVAQGERSAVRVAIPPLSLALTFELDAAATEVASRLGRSASDLPLEVACYQLSATYTALLPPALRSHWGAYYTPPALTARLLDMSEDAGIDWRDARVLDPACGGGAFLLPVALRIRKALAGVGPNAVLRHFGGHLRGFEIDPFAAWLTQAWLEIAFRDELQATGEGFPPIVTLCDSLDQQPADERFDLVIGNPPYGRVALTPEQRKRYRRGLYGHANLYGVFTDLAIRWARDDGRVALVTPTSFLSGEYFKALRGLLAEEAPPVALDLISSRKGVFEDVLQEAALAIYQKGGVAGSVPVNHLEVVSETTARFAWAGRFTPPSDLTAPWLAPREPRQQRLAERLAAMPSRLADWGYGVSTGPLVWNRHKDQLCDDRVDSETYPLIWAEAVGADGRFRFRADRRNHQPYFRTRRGDDWLKLSEPCVLVQRTTAREQARRLIVAELPAAFIAEHRCVVVENHLNMVRPLNGAPKISPATLAVVLNSTTVDRAFRCISGSVAVSAFELESLPLPSVSQMENVEALVRQGGEAAMIEGELQRLYLGRQAQ